MDAQDIDNEEMGSISPELFGGASDKGPNRQENQDAYWIPEEETPTELGSLYLVADGVGGYEDGALAADIAKRVVRTVFYELRQQGRPVSSALHEAIERANLKIIEEAQKREIRRIGATFVAAVVDQGQLTTAHVGDARAYLIRQNEMRKLTRDDSWVQKQVDAGLITEEEAANHEFRNVVTQALGNKAEITVNLSAALSIESGDIFMLCSDGLYDYLPNRQILPILTSKPPEEAAQALVDAAVAANAGDNVTTVVFKAEPFVSIAQEPTLVPGAMIAPPSSPPPPPPMTAEKKGGVPRWLIILAIIAVLLMITAVAYFWWQSAKSSDGDAGEDPGAVPGVPTEESPAVVPDGSPSPVLPTIAPTATEAVSTPTPDATLTVPGPTITSVNPEEVRGCVKDLDNPFIWTNNQISNGDCDISLQGLNPGDEVLILDDQPVIGFGTCGGAEYIEIRSVREPEKFGWMNTTLIEQGGICSP